MEPPTPKYKIGDSVWVVTKNVLYDIYKPEKARVVLIHQYPHKTEYGVLIGAGIVEVDTFNEHSSDADLIVWYTEGRVYATKEEAKVSAKEQNTSCRVKKLLEQRTELKALLDTLKKNKIVSVEKQIKKLEDKIRKLGAEYK